MALLTCATSCGGAARLSLASNTVLTAKWEIQNAKKQQQQQHTHIYVYMCVYLFLTWNILTQQCFFSLLYQLAEYIIEHAK